MKHINFVISYKDVESTTMPNFYEYGFLINKIKDLMYQKCGIGFQQFSDDETSNEIWEILEEDIESGNGKVNLLFHILDFIETATISSDHTEESLELITKPRINNSVY